MWAVHDSTCWPVPTLHPLYNESEKQHQTLMSAEIAMCHQSSTGSGMHSLCMWFWASHLISVWCGPLPAQEKWHVSVKTSTTDIYLFKPESRQECAETVMWVKVMSLHFILVVSSRAIAHAEGMSPMRHRQISMMAIWRIPRITSSCHGAQEKYPNFWRALELVNVVLHANT